MKKTIIVTVLFLMMFTVPVMAGTYSRRSYSSDKCIVRGCNRSKYNKSSYCREHKCCIYDCKNREGSDGMYCSTHHNQYYQKMVNHHKGKSSSKSSYRTKNNNSSSSRKSSFDPDDHDIESYYDDYRDEYDDYDDAYDGFLDDEDAWNDY